MENAKIIKVQLSGIRPLMFDRYAGDNNTTLPPEAKMYLNGDLLIMPAINILSLLQAQNTSSVCRQFFGKSGKMIGMGIASYTNIKPFEIPLLDKKGQIKFTGWNDQIRIHDSVARLKGGIPNPKKRPLLELPWRIEFEIEYQDNRYCTLENLHQAVEMGGTLGLGTFRPMFGRYELTGWEI